ncbi:MAG: hypothetical protein KF834_02795 [Burkholderiales bacterium]|nr:hypothetical protein [Burkholderiales bacterium]
MPARKSAPPLKLADYYMGRDRLHRGELTRELRANARETLRRVNRLLRRAGLARKVSSGWRPAAVNAAVPGAAKGSKHLSCQAVDLEDRDGRLDAWCMANLDVLEELQLWLEHPEATPGWCHLQTLPPRSGNRVFYP